MSVLDPVHIVDRDPESNRFKDLLTFATAKRVLTVSDGSGRGKTTLLRKLKWECDWRHNLPVALVPLEEYDDHPDQFKMVKDIVDQLKNGVAPVQFPVFDKLDSARAFRKTSVFLDTYQSVKGVVDAGGASVSGGQVAGVIENTKIENAETVIISSVWDERAEEAAKRLCISAFFGELADAARERTIVVLFDTVDAVTEQLQRWIFLQLVKRRVLVEGGEDQRLLVVLAGSDIHTKLEMMFKDQFQSFFDPITELGDWEQADTAKLFEVHGFTGLPDDVIGMLHGRVLQRSYSLNTALTMAAAFTVAERTK